MNHLKNFGVPLADGKPAGIVRPLDSYRFRLMKCHPNVTQQVMNVQFNNAAKSVEIKLRATIQPECMKAALNFTNNTHWHVEAMDGGNNGVYFGLQPSGLKLLDHTFGFDYAVGGCVVHTFVFKYDSLEILYPMTGEEPDVPPAKADPDFPSIADAMTKFDEEKKVTGE